MSQDYEVAPAELQASTSHHLDTEHLLSTNQQQSHTGDASTAVSATRNCNEHSGCGNSHSTDGISAASHSTSQSKHIYDGLDGTTTGDGRAASYRGSFFGGGDLEDADGTQTKEAQDEEQLHMQRVIVSSIVGNTLEWYDFLAYVYLGSVISHLFFPPTNVFSRLLAYYGIFAAGFVVRPLGALLFGYIGDRWGRRAALVASMYAMSVPTFLMGCLPTYSQVGVAAPVLLVLTRMCQGFAVGGEFSSTIVFLVEHAPRHHRGIVGSLAFMSVMVGVLAGSLVSTLVIGVMPRRQLEAWGWRLPFLVSILGSAVGVYIRRHLKEPPAEAVSAPQHTTRLLGDAHPLMRAASGMFVVMLIDFTTAIGFYLTVIFLPLYFVEIAGLSARGAAGINLANMVLYMAVIPVGGALADRVGNALTLLVPCLLLAVLGYPVWMLFKVKSLAAAWFGQAVLSALMALFTGALPATFVALFAAQHRCTGLSLSHNLSMAAFGGTAPILATALIKGTGDIASPAALMIVAAAFSIAGVALLRFFSVH